MEWITAVIVMTFRPEFEPPFTGLPNVTSLALTRLGQREAEAMVTTAATLLDVREADEYAQGAIPGALHLPRGFLEVQVEGVLPDKNRPIVVYCAGGYRSSIAASALRAHGFDDVSDVLGGYGACALTGGANR